MAAFLALWLVVLSGRPCCDALAAPRGQAAFQAASPHQDGCTDATDACSPLCACSCCAVGLVLTPAPVPDFRPAVTAAAPAFSPHPSGTPAGNARAVWQPPQNV